MEGTCVSALFLGLIAYSSIDRTLAFVGGIHNPKRILFAVPHLDSLTIPLLLSSPLCTNTPLLIHSGLSISIPLQRQ
jgi:hypothetical protein